MILDHMTGPFLLPDSVKAGDYIEIGMLGAYGCAMRTAFNGFGTAGCHLVHDQPMDSLYTGVEGTCARQCCVDQRLSKRPNQFQLTIDFTAS